MFYFEETFVYILLHSSSNSNGNIKQHKKAVLRVQKIIVIRDCRSAVVLLSTKKPSTPTQTASRPENQQKPLLHLRQNPAVKTTNTQLRKSQKTKQRIQHQRDVRRHQHDQQDTTISKLHQWIQIKFTENKKVESENPKRSQNVEGQNLRQQKGGEGMFLSSLPPLSGSLEKRLQEMMGIISMSRGFT